MATTHVMPKKLGDLLLQEVMAGWTKGAGVLATGAAYPMGTVLALVSGKYQAVDLAGTGAAKKAVAVLGETVDATAADATSRVIIKRGAVVALDALVWPAGATEPQTTAALAELDALGIVAVAQV
ncbi:head decoration protein [Alcaligenaceae bacterium]|nr:head decoration protein [Alcaligenaceae bacterium]